eukprot:g9683.t1
MEVRWRLFARDVLSLLANDAGEYRFGRPPRPVRGLRLLGVVVHRERGGTSGTEDGSRRHEEKAKAGSAVGNGKRRGRGTGGVEDASGDESLVEAEFGLLRIDDGTGAVEVRLPLRLWEGIAFSDQVDIVGTPERPPALSSATRVRIKADGCYVESDPNVATLRALECINLYKACYFSSAWSPSAVPLPPLLPDPQPVGKADGKSFVGTNCDCGNGAAGAAAGPGGAGAEPQLRDRRSGGGAESAPSVEGLLGLIGSMGGATAEQLAVNLGLPPGHAGVASALDQMQLEGAIYQAGDRYMPL